ncbi:MAG TPA: beta-N-acetylglucosaminidase domain-containing protein, partial [Jatrophihabitans sp.]|nr:beta-N-acetylglucosaminidase domain-containing protein [Jatrophihabitans sp.]
MPGSRLATVGTIEGFYGPPWSFEQRLDHLRFAAAAGFDTVVYAPKDDPYHRRRWREPYPEPELGRIAELAGTAAGLGLRFVYALHPALDMRYAEDGEHATLAAKAAQVHGAGVREFALLFDDVPYELGEPDAAVFGAGAAGLGAAHGTTAARFRDGFLAGHGIPGPLLVCPTDYAGVEPSAYRDAFAAAAPAEVVLTWTGRGVVVGTVTRAEIDAAFASYRRPLVLWDNFPVNDYDPSRLFLGPLTGRPADVEGSALVGVIGNAMIEEAPSRIPLATTAAWARSPGTYRPAAAHAAA